MRFGLSHICCLSRTVHLIIFLQISW